MWTWKTIYQMFSAICLMKWYKRLVSGWEGNILWSAWACDALSSKTDAGKYIYFEQVFSWTSPLYGNASWRMKATFSGCPKYLVRTFQSGIFCSFVTLSPASPRIWTERMNMKHHIFYTQHMFYCTTSGKCNTTMLNTACKQKSFFSTLYTERKFVSGYNRDFVIDATFANLLHVHVG